MKPNTQLPGSGRPGGEPIVWSEVAEGMRHGVMVWQIADADSRDLRLAGCNAAAAAFLGLDRRKEAGRPMTDVLPWAGQNDLPEVAVRTFTTGRGMHVADVAIPEDNVVAVDVFSLKGNYVGMTLTDVTERARLTDSLRHQALHDPLTGLGNRTMLHERLRYSMALGRRDSRCLAVLVMDLDDFKTVNDTWGHHIGDLLLQRIALRLRAIMRDSDSVARLGGDEFAIIVSNISGRTGAAGVAERIAEAVALPVDLGSATVQVRTSIGVCVYPQHGSDPEQLVKLADRAMFQAKRSNHDVAVVQTSGDSLEIASYQSRSRIRLR